MVEALYFNYGVFHRVILDQDNLAIWDGESRVADRCCAGLGGFQSAYLAAWLSNSVIGSIAILHLLSERHEK